MAALPKKPISSYQAPRGPPAFLRMSDFPFSFARFGFACGDHSHLVSENLAIRLPGVRTPVGGQLPELDLRAAMPTRRPDPWPLTFSALGGTRTPNLLIRSWAGGVQRRPQKSQTVANSLLDGGDIGSPRNALGRDQTRWDEIVGSNVGSNVGSSSRSSPCRLIECVRRRLTRPVPRWLWFGPRPSTDVGVSSGC